MAELNSIYSALSILLVFIPILASKNIEEANRFLNNKIDSTQEKKLLKYQNDLKKFLSTSCLFNLSINLILIYLLTPTLVDICKKSSFNFINFELEITLFVFIYILIGYFLIIQIGYLKKLVIRLVKNQ